MKCVDLVFSSAKKSSRKTNAFFSYLFIYFPRHSIPFQKTWRRSLGGKDFFVALTVRSESGMVHSSFIGYPLLCTWKITQSHTPSLVRSSPGATQPTRTPYFGVDPWWAVMSFLFGWLIVFSRGFQMRNSLNILSESHAFSVLHAIFYSE